MTDTAPTWSMESKTSGSMKNAEDNDFCVE